MTKKDFEDQLEGVELHTLTHFVTITQLPTGAREVAVNTDRLEEKIAYIKESYNDNMELKSKPRTKGCLGVKVLSIAFA